MYIMFASFLGKMGKHCGQRFATDLVGIAPVAIAATYIRKFTDGLEETIISLGGIALREEMLPTLGVDDIFHSPYILWIS